MYNNLSVQTHNIRNIFLVQLVNKTADCFNNIVFILAKEISSKKVCEIMENNSKLEKVLLACNRNAELLRLVGATFDSKNNFLQKNEEKKFDNSENFEGKVSPFFCFIRLSLLTFELSNINWKCSEYCNMLTERTYNSAVFKIFLNIITICIFIEQ